MGNFDFTLASGAKLHISSAPFQDAIELSKARMRCLKGLQIKDPSVGFDSAITVASSDEVERAFFKCAEKAAYEGIIVTKGLFDDPKIGDQARSDYIEIMKRIMEVNCDPFFSMAASKSAQSGQIESSVPK